MELSFVIINYNLADEIQDCINTILNEVNGIQYEIIVVDNNSPDAPSDKFDKIFPQEKFPNIRFFYLSENKGFGSGCNFGAAKSNAEIICFLNPDVVIKKNVFNELLRFLNSDEHIAAVGPRSTGKNCFDFSAGVFPNIFFEVLNIFFLGRHIEALYINLKQIFKGKTPFSVDWILGASIIIKKRIFDSIKGFDEDYFLYFEEMDLFYRLKKSNYKIFYCPAEKIEHIGSASTKKDYSFFTRTFYLSKLLFFEKRFNPFKAGLFKYLTYMQMLTQLFLWSLLIPFSREKSMLKISGFWQVLTSGSKNYNSNTNKNGIS